VVLRDRGAFVCRVQQWLPEGTTIPRTQRHSLGSFRFLAPPFSTVLWSELLCMGSNPGEGEIFHTCPDRLWGPRSHLYNGYWVFFPWVIRSGRGVDPHPPLSGSEVKESVELYLHSPSGPSWPVLGRTLRFTLPVLVVLGGGQIVPGTGLSSSTSVFPCRHCSTFAPCSSITDTMKS